MSDLPIKKNVARTVFVIGLTSQANIKLLKVNPTIAADDFMYSKDGGTWTNLSTLPDVYPAGGTQVRLQLSQAELNCDQLNIRWIDAAGAEWCDGGVMIMTAALQTADAPTNSAGVATILSDYARRTGDYATALSISSLQSDVTSIKLDYARRTGDYSVLTASDVWSYVTRSLTTSGGVTAAEVWDYLTTGTIVDNSILKLIVNFIDAKISSRATLGGGMISEPITVTDGTNPLDGCYILITSDLAGTNNIASGYTDASGTVTFNLNAGTYYLWLELSGYNFSNPQTVTVS